MTLVLKPDFKFAYPKINTNFQYVNSAFHPSLYCWVLLVITPDGEFHSVKREHVTRVTKLEVALT